MATDHGADIAAVQGIAAVPRILEVVCRSTGMGFAAVARVTEQRWICLRGARRDRVRPDARRRARRSKPPSATRSGKAVRLSSSTSVADDMAFCGHHTPAHVRLPELHLDADRARRRAFFGTLCAIDPRPARLNTPQTIGMFKLFAELIAYASGRRQTCSPSSEARLLGRTRDFRTARAVHRRARPRPAQPAGVDRGRHQLLLERGSRRSRDRSSR